MKVKKVIKKFFKFTVIPIIFIIPIFIAIFVWPTGYDMYYNEPGYEQQYQIKKVDFDSTMRDHQNIAFEPNKSGFRRGLFYITAYMNEPLDVTVNSFETHLVYNSKTVLLSKTEVNDKMSFQKTEYNSILKYRYESAGGGAQVFYIPDSELKKIKGVKVTVSVTVSDETESVTEDMTFYYDADYKGYSIFDGTLRSV